MIEDKEWLRSMYEDRLYTIQEIADVAGVSWSVIRTRMKWFEIKIRSRSEQRKLDWGKGVYSREERSSRMKDLWKDPEYRKGQKESRDKYWNSKESRIICSVRNRKRYEDPEARILIGIRSKEAWTDERRKKHSEHIRELWKENWYRDHHVSSRIGSNNPNWKGGRSFELYPVEFNSEFKIGIRGREKNSCFYCGGKPSSRKLDVHHIDYDKSNTVASNCVAVCRSCNSKFNFNRSYWKIVLREMLKEYHV